jgi:hypothetical protein
MSFTTTYNNLSVRGYQTPGNNAYLGRLVTGNTSANQFIGQSLSLSADGNTLLVGATTTTSLGKVLVFSKVSNVWTITANINSPNVSVGTFGYSVDINSSGNTAIIGAPSFGNVSSPGDAFIYANVSNTWTLQTTLSPNVVSNIDTIGFSVAINDNGDKVATGTPSANAAANVYSKVFTFDKSGNTWTQTAILGNTLEDAFGSSISMDSTGNYLVVGAPADDTLNQNSGKVYVYNNLSLQQSFTSNLSPSPGLNYGFGTQVDINSAGNRILARPPFANSELWDRSSNTWTFTTNFATGLISLAPTGNALLAGNVVFIENSPNNWTVPLILQPTDITASGPDSSVIQYPGYIFAGYTSEDSPATDIGAVGVWQIT